MNQTNSIKNQFESTYALLVRSEEKGRGILETALYALFGLSAVVAICQFALQPITVPAAGLEPAPKVVYKASVEQNCARS